MQVMEGKAFHPPKCSHEPYGGPGAVRNDIGKNNRPCCALLVEIHLAQEFTRTRDDDSGFTFSAPGGSWCRSG